MFFISSGFLIFDLLEHVFNKVGKFAIVRSLEASTWHIIDTSVIPTLVLAMQGAAYSLILLRL